MRSDSWHPHLINLVMDWSSYYGSSASVISLYLSHFLTHTHARTCARAHTHTCFHHSLGLRCSGIRVSAVLLPQGAGYSTVFTSWVLLPSLCSHVRLALAHVRHRAETFTTPVLELVAGLSGTSGLLGEVLVGGVGMLMIAVVTWLLLLQFTPPDSSGIMLRLERLWDVCIRERERKQSQSLYSFNYFYLQ